MLKRLSEDQLVGILSRALLHWRCEGQQQKEHKPEEEEALRYLANFSDGDGKLKWEMSRNREHESVTILSSKECLEYFGSCLERITIKGRNAAGRNC